MQVYAGPSHQAQKPITLEIDHARAKKFKVCQTHLFKQRARRKEPSLEFGLKWIRDDNCQWTDSRDFFPSDTHRMIITEPLRITNTDGSVDIDATIDGGGSTKAGALRLGISRALIDIDGDHRESLKKAGFLTKRLTKERI